MSSVARVARVARVALVARVSRVPCPLARLYRRRHSLDDERLDHVADLDVVVLLEADAALEAGLDLGDVVLEPAQRADPALVDDDVVAEEPRLRIAGAGNRPLDDNAAGNWYGHGGDTSVGQLARAGQPLLVQWLE